MQAHQAKLVGIEARTQRMNSANRIAEAKLEEEQKAAKKTGKDTTQIAIQLAEVQNKIKEFEELISNPPEQVLERGDKIV